MLESSPDKYKCMGGGHRTLEGDPILGLMGGGALLVTGRVTEDADEQIQEAPGYAHTSHLITAKQVATMGREHGFTAHDPKRLSSWSLMPLWGPGCNAGSHHKVRLQLGHPSCPQPSSSNPSNLTPLGERSRFPECLYLAGISKVSG